MLTVERLDDGEVSPYLVDELRPGDELELRGPIGGYFVWEASLGGPLLLVAGGSGIVPFRAMLRHRMASHSDAPVRLGGDGPVSAADAVNRKSANASTHDDLGDIGHGRGDAAGRRPR